MSEQQIDYDEWAHELNWCAVWRAGTDHPVAGIRAALADVLELGHGDLAGAVAAAYADDPATATAYTEVYIEGFAASEDRALQRAGRLLRDARASLWDARDGL